MSGQRRTEMDDTRRAMAEAERRRRKDFQENMNAYIYEKIKDFLGALKFLSYGPYKSLVPNIDKSIFPSPDELDLSFNESEEIFKNLASTDPNYPISELVKLQMEEKKAKYTSKSATAPIRTLIPGLDDLLDSGVFSLISAMESTLGKGLEQGFGAVKYGFDLFDYYRNLEDEFTGTQILLDKIVPKDIEPSYQVLTSYQLKFGSLEQHSESEKFKNAQISMAQAIFEQIEKGYDWEQLEAAKDFMPLLDQTLNIINTGDYPWLQPRYSQLGDPLENPESSRFNRYLFQTVMEQINDSVKELGIEKIENIFQGSETDPSNLSAMLKNLETNALKLSNYWGSIEHLSNLGLRADLPYPVNFDITSRGGEDFLPTDGNVFSDFASPEERGHILTEEEIERIKKLQQIPIVPNESSDVTSKIVSDIEEMNRNAFIFSDKLSDVAHIAGQLGGAFMNVNENIGRAIGSAGGFAGGISNVLGALKRDPLEGVDTSRMTPEQIEAAREQGEKQKGLALMGGIQGAFAGLQGLFGGEAGSDTSQLLGGLGGVGAGVAGLLTGNPLEGITSLISGLPALIDGLTESTQEGYAKQLSKQGFNDTYSEDLLDKMSEVSDKMGDKSFGMKAYIEDFFKETNIDTAEEFGRMSDLLNESVGEYVAQGHTMDEAYDKFGDELEQLNEAQEKYGFETVASLDNMLEQQRTQTKEGRIEGLKGALGGYDKIISGLEKQMKLTPDFKLSEASISGIAGSLTNTYQELINQGMGAGEAVEAVKPLLTHYSEMAQQQGWDLSKVPGFSQLSTYFESLDKASGALDMIQGSADVVKALSSSGMMDQTTLQGQESLGLDVMHQLEASGLNETQRLQQMSGWLQSMQQASEKGGLTLSPEVQALISKAEEKGVMPEEEKPVGDVISEGIVAGFEKACGVIDNYFGKLTEYGEGGIIPGAPGGKKLVWAHAGEAIGYPAEIENPAKMPAPLMEPAINGIANTFKQRDNKLATGWNPLLDKNLGGSQWAQQLSPDGFKASLEQANAQNGAALKDQVSGEGQKLDISQTIENKMSLAVNSRDFVQTLKQDIYDQIKEDSKRGLISIHDKAIKSY